jgi:GT2 family glycosyltransferase
MKTDTEQGITSRRSESSFRQDAVPSGPHRRGLVYIIVLNWNGWRDTAECLSSLGALDYEDCRLLVVDNGSVDDSVRRLRADFPEVEILEAGTNLGFAGGNNLGIRYGLAHGAEFIWLVNNDTKVDSRALTVMVEAARANPRIGVVGSVLYHMEQPQKIQYWGGGVVNLWLGRSSVFTRQVDDQRLQYLSGASMLLRRQALEEVGLLDDGFFMYWEDSDLCFRYRKAGWGLAVAPGSKIWHKQCGSLGKKSSQVDLFMKTSMVRFLQRHAPVPFLSIFLGVSLMMGNRIVQQDWVRARALWQEVLADLKREVA